MTTLIELKDLLDAHAIIDGHKDAWEIKVNSEVTRVTAATPAIQMDPADAFADASSLVDQILALGYKLVFANTISASSNHQDRDYQESDAVTYRGVINIGLQPSTD